MEDKKRNNVILSIKERIAILGLYSGSLLLLNFVLFNRVIPSNSNDGLWLISCIGFLSFNLLSSPFFIKPSDSIASAFSVLLLLWTIDLSGIKEYLQFFNNLRLFSIYFNLLVIGFGIISTIYSLPNSNGNTTEAIIGRISYSLCVVLGKGAIVFAPPVLISIFGFNQDSLLKITILGLSWIVIVTIKPIELIFNIIKSCKSLYMSVKDIKNIGKIQRIDSPNIIRISLLPDYKWDKSDIKIACLSENKSAYVIPLFSQNRDNGLVGTGLCCEYNDEKNETFVPGSVYEIKNPINRNELLKSIIGKELSVDLVGFVVEGSCISFIKFEVSGDTSLRQGNIVFCKQNDTYVYYQIIDANTAEENFESNPRGTHIVIATQLGLLDDSKGFKKFAWLPSMNTPIFLPTDGFDFEATDEKEDSFDIGIIPGLDIRVKANFDDLLEYHTAVLGVTGTGKTEVVFDIIRSGLAEGAKIFCVDLTGEYKNRLKKHNPVLLGLSTEEIDTLEELIFAVESGEFTASKEKRAYRSFVKSIRPDIEKRVDQFLSTEEECLGIFELPEIANTKATLCATELYLSEIFNWARRNRKARKILIVLEEAHTIIPEINFFGYDKGDTSAVIGRMSQIALQGRKYGVGLLIVSQRTALVSKTVLSQCNTYITFSLVDKTSLDYLSSVYSQDHVKVIPNLQTRQALVFGKGIKSERPIVVEIPYDPQKKADSEALNVILNTSAEEEAALGVEIK